MQNEAHKNFNSNNDACASVYRVAIYTTSGMAITVEALDFENNCVEGRQARDNNYVEIERDTREE